jgi:CspA family cold shock protein
LGLAPLVHLATVMQNFCGQVGTTVSCSFEPLILFLENWVTHMAEATIKRITDRGFGFINNGTDKDLFFHSSSVEGDRFGELREGQRVSYDISQGPKGPRAENVQVI